MGLAIVDDTSLTGIANAIRSKTGGGDTYKPSEMAAAVNAMPGYKFGSMSADDSGYGTVTELGFTPNFVAVFDIMHTSILMGTNCYIDSSGLGYSNTGSTMDAATVQAMFTLSDDGFTITGSGFDDGSKLRYVAGRVSG